MNSVEKSKKTASPSSFAPHLYTQIFFFVKVTGIGPYTEKNMLDLIFAAGVVFLIGYLTATIVFPESF